LSRCAVAEHGVDDGGAAAGQADQGGAGSNRELIDFVVGPSPSALNAAHPVPSGSGDAPESIGVGGPRCNTKTPQIANVVPCAGRPAAAEGDDTAACLMADQGRNHRGPLVGSSDTGVLEAGSHAGIGGR
jgi:hypothetical protein